MLAPTLVAKDGAAMNGTGSVARGRPGALGRALFALALLVGTALVFGCAGGSVSEDGDGLLEWDYDERGVHELTADESRAMALSRARDEVIAFEAAYIGEDGDLPPEGSPFAFSLGAPLLLYGSDSIDGLEESARMYPLFKDEELHALIRIEKRQLRSAAWDITVRRDGLERFAELFESRQPFYLVSDVAWRGATLWVSRTGEMGDAGVVVFADGIEPAQKQWREKASRVDDQIIW